MKTPVTFLSSGKFRSLFVLLFLYCSMHTLKAQESLENLVLKGEEIASINDLSDYQKNFYQQLSKRWKTIEYETLEYVKNEAEFLFLVECYKEELSIVAVVIPTTAYGMLTVIVEWDDTIDLVTFYVDFKDWEIEGSDVE